MHKTTLISEYSHTGGWRGWLGAWIIQRLSHSSVAWASVGMQWRGLNSAAGLASAQLRCSDNHRPVMNDNCVLFTSVYGNLFTDLDYKFWKLNMSNDFLPILKGSAVFQPWLCLNFGHCGINWFCPVGLTSAFKKHLRRHVFYPLPQFLVLLKKKSGRGKRQALGRDYKKWLSFSPRFIGDQ